MPRMYEEVWKRIKKDKKVTLQVEPFLVPRVSKAVKKEKYMDLGFKVINGLDYYWLKIIYEENTKHLIFELHQRYGIVETIA